MKRILMILIILLLFTSVVSASYDEWTPFQKKMYLSYTGFVTIDLIQSRHWIEYSEDNYRYTPYGNIFEGNNLVAGKSIECVNAMAIAANYFLYRYIDKVDSNTRTFMLLTMNIIEGFNVYTNHIDMKKHNFEYDPGIDNMDVKITFLSWEF